MEEGGCALDQRDPSIDRKVPGLYPSGDRDKDVIQDPLNLFKNTEIASDQCHTHRSGTNTPKTFAMRINPIKRHLICDPFRHLPRACPQDLQRRLHPTTEALANVCTNVPPSGVPIAQPSGPYGRSLRA